MLTRSSSSCRRKGSTLTDLRRLLEETPKTYQGSAYKDDIEKLDPDAFDFFKHHFYADAVRGTRAGIARRIHSLLAIPAFRRMFTASANALDLYSEMNRGTIVLVNTNVNLLKEDGMALLGRYVIARALGAAFERAPIPLRQRKPTYLIVDEAAPYFDDTFERLFTRARQFKLATIMAFQHLEQASDRLKSAIASSTRVKYAAGLGYKDRMTLARDMETTPEFIQSMKKDTNEPPQWAQFACYVRPDFDTACVQTIPFYQLENMPKMSEAAHQQLLAQNKRRLSPPSEPVTTPEGTGAAISQTNQQPTAGNIPSSSKPTSAAEESEKRISQDQSNAITKNGAQSGRKLTPSSLDHPDPSEPSSDWKP